MTNKEQIIYDAAEKQWGKEAQLVQAVEELSELIKAICKYLNRGGEIKYIFEETADVEIMCAQIRHMFTDKGSDFDIDTYKNFKLDRLAVKLSLLDIK